MKFTDLKTRTKITLMVAFSVITAVILGSAGSYLLQYSLDEFEAQKANSIRPIIWLRTVQTSVTAIQANMLEGIAIDDKKHADSLVEINKIREEQIVEAMKNFERAGSSGKAADDAKKRLDTAFAAYESDKEKARELARAAFTPEARDAFYQFFSGNLAASYRECIIALDNMINISTAANIAAQARLNEEISRYIMTFIAVIIISAIILLAIGFLLTRSITGVLSDVTSVAVSISENNLTRKLLSDTVERKDEFGNMGRALKVMQDNLTGTIKSIGSIAENIAASSQELHANADQTARASGEVANATTTIMSETEQTGREVQKALGLIESTEIALKDMAENTNQVALTAEDTAKTSHEGQESVETAVISINSVGEGTVKITDAVTDLKESSSRISDIVEMITGIASQTNLLALNAAIEAARAGEHGRGFAVVAEEVRKLAEESGNAAEQIGELIGKNTVSIDRTVSLMDEQRELVGQGVEKVNLSGQAFAKIAQMVENLSGQVQSISAGVEESAASSIQIVNANRAITESSNKVIEEVTTVSAAAQQQAASTEEIASGSQVLAQMAEDLNVIAAKFIL